VATSSPRHWLLIRRKISDPADLGFFYCHAPALVSLPILIKVAGKRWPVEECFQQGKGQTGLDQHQLRLWHSFCRHTVLSMCALALLAVATARPPGTPVPRAAARPGTSTGTTDQPEHWRDTGRLPARAEEAPPENIGLTRVTVPEARRLLALLALPAHRASEIFQCAWSIWRRRHQARLTPSVGCSGPGGLPGANQYMVRNFGSGGNSSTELTGSLTCDQQFGSGGCSATPGQSQTEGIELIGPESSGNTSSSWTVTITWAAGPLGS
jgi:hypothetical protein